MTSTLDSPSDTAWMRQAFIGVQEELTLKTRLASGSIDHPGIQGGVNEDHWIDIFRAYLPDRYQVASGVVVDSRGLRSDQIDLVIFDRHFTPTLLDQQKHRYIPAEAVYAVFECKPQLDKGNIEYAGGKAASVRKLHRTSVDIPHAGGTHPAKPLFPIVAGIVARRANWADGLGASFKEALPRDDESLDCGCALEHGSFDTFDGCVRIAPPEGALIHFLFRLLSKLQSLGTVPAIDWAAYAKVLR